MYDDTLNAVDVLRLHADLDGIVWYGTDSLPFENSGRSVAEFYRNPSVLNVPLRGARTIRLLGTADNAQLIVGLKRLHHDDPAVGRRQAVLLGSPMVVPSPAMRANAESVLQAMWQLGTTAAVPGCWHRMTHHDYTTYAIITEFRLTGGQPSELARRTLRYHPAWPALSFLSALDEDAACKLVAEIVEPRWFRHPFRPNRLTRLNSYLGLTPANMAAFVAGERGGRHYERAQTVLTTWAYGFKHSMNGPNGFLQRIADRAESGKYHVGLLRASERFARFLFEVWTAESTDHPDVKFDPRRFFKRDDEASAYVEHRRAIRV